MYLVPCITYHFGIFYSPGRPIVDVRKTRLCCPLYKLNASIVFPDFHRRAQCLHVSRAIYYRIESLNIISVIRRRNQWSLNHIRCPHFHTFSLVR